ncbi:phosphatase PAP2 family protein [Pseudochryseolinea flava]|uniref:PAP2 family protein n=1 Tax=Pseudochryseolinea flava TaxID=2059302 RepID=A0A364Y3R1_9BACT|nr:phosphatase PAP2 family protein [Pseudochryseolinea flava]RAW00974.1 PAP2 family protein [Pseudochryseolinea flava]
MHFICFLFFLCICSVTLAQVKSQSDTSFSFSLAEQPAKKQSELWKAAKTPTVLISLGVLSCVNDDIINRYEIREERNEHMPNFRSTVDNYLMHAPVAIVYGLNAIGVKGKHDFKNRTLLLVKSEAIMAALTFSFKSMTKVSRPDDSNNYSFPSGHTAQAFATATFLAKEYGEKNIWYSIGAYGMATTVGAMRILNNRHWVSDVLAGAGIGILSTNLAYLTHRYKWSNKNSNVTLLPAYTNGPGVYFCYNIK